jgi:hypothetical protein
MCYEAGCGMADPDDKADALQRSSPAELSVDEVKDVLRRAAEIEHGGEQERLSIAEVEALAAELGVSREAVRQAAREVRSSALVPAARAPGALERLLGPRRVVLQRAVPGPTTAARAHIDRYLTGQLFRVTRELGDRAVWGPAAGMKHSLRRAVDLAGTYELPTGVELDVVIAEAGADVDVVIAVDLARTWDAMVVTAGILGTLGLAAGVVVGAVLTPWALPLGGALGLGGVALSRRSYRGDVEAAVKPLERMLDALQHRTRRES